MTPELSRKRGRRWLVASVAVIALNIAIDMLGFDMLEFPLRVAALVCFMFAGLRIGWSDGWRDAEKRFAHMVRCNETMPPLFGGHHEHRCVHPVLECDPQHGRPEHKCRCNMTWIAVPEEARP